MHAAQQVSEMPNDTLGCLQEGVRMTQWEYFVIPSALDAGLKVPLGSLDDFSIGPDHFAALPEADVGHVAGDCPVVEVYADGDR